MTETMAKLTLKRRRLENRIAALSRERDDVLTAMAAEEGFKPCSDCLNGWCSMNCSSAPGYIKTYA